MSKYGNRRVLADGYRFDSLAEYARYQELKLLAAAGELDELRVHPRYLLQEGFRYKGKTERPIFYEADFSYRETDGALVVEDVKGTRTPAYLLKRKLFLAKYRTVYDFREIAA